MKIEIVSTQAIKPCTVTPPHLRDFKLSFIDERIPPSYIPLILYYTSNEDSNISQSEMCDRLKTSLSDALAQFYPLAGRMKGQISVDCNDDGVLYAEATADANVLDIVESPHPQILDDLVPFVTNGYVSDAPEQLAVQVTSFNCGGITIGLCISHRIADGCTLSSFIKHWAATARGDGSSGASPVFNSATLFPPRNTPDFTPNSNSPSVQPLSPNLVTRRFIFTPSSIQSLQREAAASSGILKPTRVEVVTALIWSRCMAAKGAGNGNGKGKGKSVAYHTLNLRGKVPALSENSFGNLFQMIRAESGAAEAGWVPLVGKLRAAFDKVDDEYVKRLLGEKGFDLAKENFMEISRVLAAGDVEVFRFSSYCRFAVYGGDFGWGRPVWVSNSSYRNKNCVFLFDSVDCSGGIEAWVVMSDRDMERLEQDLEFPSFASCFLS
ncbi:stemmadenine O-acetyltransferase-like [Salvia miltiorrhiza]|uniref:stemmadenine O-acetyltransferase-like n=1 Tax=Salvia miltiorrhiza TaxID=226208 RepID=UPI0025AD3C44|nr:stemmadenine O-acetyltransferase-like [Salvia miltiorrhiza]